MPAEPSVSSLPYSVTVQDDDYVVRIDRHLLTRDDLSSLLDYFLLRSITQKSQASQEEIDALADEVDRAVVKTLRPDTTS